MACGAKRKKTSKNRQKTTLPPLEDTKSLSQEVISQGPGLTREIGDLGSYLLTQSEWYIIIS